ncbi:MAG: hypothetical protein NTW29_06975 [Bacteroidetes bacterium]|nr:hypothetical protein [Bacteroidota bacterium]
MIGPAVPVNAPKVVMDALTGIQVTNSKERSGFQISFSVGKDSALLNNMLPAGYFDPITTRVIIIATVQGSPTVLMDGFVTNHQLSPSSEPGKSTLTITGEDISVAMDLFELIIPLPAMPDIAKVYTVLAPFSFLGVVPVVIPSPISPILSPTDKWNSINKQTPLAYLKSLAQNCGNVFYIIPGPSVGQSIAYFGPEINLPIPQAALSVNMDAHTNVDALSFTMDGLAKKIRVYTIFDPITKKITIPIPVPNVNVLKPPMGLRSTQPIWKAGFAGEFSKEKPDAALQKIMGDIMSSSKNPLAVKGNGSLDVLRYKGILRAGMRVGVRGGGIAYDGMYYVDSVTHNIKPGEYKQSFTLSRDGIVSDTSFVRI